MTDKHTNRLAGETSPYLLQHAHNPVDWYPWGDEALARAKAEGKPILLSIGYSACHWCHVMERESFEDEQTAALMNDMFVCIKVDREERPDLDAIYMQAVQMLTGSGGWPLNVFLRPDGVPFFGGTYFPPVDRYGMSSWTTVLRALADAYTTRRDDIDRSAGQLLKFLRQSTELAAKPGEPTEELLVDAVANIARSFDARLGGFGRAPKFPASMVMDFLLRHHARTGDVQSLRMVEFTLEKMAAGGIYDQVGGGFARYSVDEQWLVPHFEKMLYDNALLARVYTDAFRATGKALYRRVAEETLDWVLREMTAECGAFYSALDADSEGEEGKFYVWSRKEVMEVLGDEDGRLFSAYYDITDEGNFEGHNIPNTPRDLDAVAAAEGVTTDALLDVISRGRVALYERRIQRVWPGLDDKTLAAWNGIMLRAFAEAAVAFNRDDYLEAARLNADFLLTEMRRDGLLLRTWKGGEAKLNAYLEDYAYVIEGLLALYEATFGLRWLAEARDLADVMIREFWDEKDGGFFFTGNSHEELIRRTKDLEDNATPSGNSSAAWGLAKLAELTGDLTYREKAARIVGSAGEALDKYARAFGHMLCAADALVYPPVEVAIVGDPADAATQALIAEARLPYRTGVVVAACAPGDEEAAALVPILAERGLVDGKPAAYVCRAFTCKLPVTTVEELAADLR